MPTLSVSRFLPAILVCASCGPSEDSPTAPTPLPNFGSVQVTIPKLTVGSEVKVTPAPETLSIRRACKRDVMKKEFYLAFSSPDRRMERSTELVISGLGSHPKTYTCMQAADNPKTTTFNATTTYDDCMVRATVPSFDAQPESREFSMFEMHRTNERAPFFKYEGTCKIDVTSIDSLQIKGKVDCTKLVRTFTLFTDKKEDLRPERPLVIMPQMDVVMDFQCFFE